MLNTTAE